jgi:hypothetical protein
MSSTGQPLSSRVQQLLEVVDQDREKRCAELLDQARAEADAIVRQAWRKTRVRLHHEVLQAREQYRHHLLLEQASNAARRRQLSDRVDRAWLEQAWQPLQEALIRRWQTAESRTLWIEAVTRQAMARLLRRDWQIEHPSDWPTAEQQQLASRLQAALGETPVFVADPALRAGLRVRAEGTCVDGSCAGLLRDRAHIEALLLAAARGAGHV